MRYGAVGSVTHTSASPSVRQSGRHQAPIPSRLSPAQCPQPSESPECRLGCWGSGHMAQGASVELLAFIEAGGDGGALACRAPGAGDPHTSSDGSTCVAGIQFSPDHSRRVGCAGTWAPQRHTSSADKSGESIGLGAQLGRSSGRSGPLQLWGVSVTSPHTQCLSRRVSGFSSSPHSFPAALGGCRSLVFSGYSFRQSFPSPVTEQR